MNRNQKRNYAAVVLAAAAMVLLTACAETSKIGGADGPTELIVSDAGGNGMAQTANGISVTGEGRVYITPDVAELTFGIHSEAADPVSVKNQNTEEYNRVIAFLKEQGISEESIKTANLGMNPIYDWSGNTQKTVGYTMQTDITVSDIAMDAVGTILNSAVDAGVNYIQSVTYKSSQFDIQYNEALKLAIQNAEQKADAMAEAGGVKRGKALRIFENGANTAARYTRTLAAAPGANMKEMAVDAAMNVEPGQLEILAHVSVDYAIE